MYIATVIIGLIFTFIVLGVCWVLVIKPIYIALSPLVEGTKKSLGISFIFGTKLGGKISETKKKVVEPEGEPTEEALFFDGIKTPDYEIARWVDSQSIPKVGYVLYRAYEKYLERTLVITDKPTVVKKLGKRIPMQRVEGNFLKEDLSIRSLTVEEVTKLIETGKPKLLAVSAPKEVKVADVQPNEVAPAPIPAASKKGMEKYVGYLINFGKAARHMSSSPDDDGNNGKEIEQFRVVIRNADGVDENIWGQDLFRAIKDAGVKINDKVEVVKTGKRQFGSSWKNLYAVTKLA